MNPRDTNDYGRILQTLRSELVSTLPGRDAILIEQAPDALDQTQSAAARDLAVETLNRHSTRLREVDAALKRISEGTYGVCMECEEDISARRLKALPWATHCIACQQRRDTRGAVRTSLWFDTAQDLPAAA